VLSDITTRARVLILVVAAALPSILVAVYVAVEQRGLSLQRTADEMNQRLDLIEALLPAFRLDALPRRGAETLGRGQMVTVIDDAGLVIAQQPPLFAQPGERFPNEAVLDGLARGETFFDLTDPSGVRRMYAARRIDRMPESASTIIISMPKSMVYEHVDRALGYSIAGIIIAAMALLLIASLGAERMVLAPIRRMLGVTGRVRGGDLTARTGMRAGREELSQLGASLDAMADQLAEREHALRRALNEQTRLAQTDSLTGLYNRRFLRDAVQRQIAVATRTGKPFSLILFDLDHFKRVNDAFGHDAGDVVLAQTARVLMSIVRSSDFAVRHGGEEFAVLLPDTNLAVAAERAEEIRQAIESNVCICGTEVLRVTASFGVVQFEAGADDAALLTAVDAAMYAAKAAGRNRVVLSREIMRRSGK
jgi:diguanylate cyclase (GGDEF)-like protein